MSIDVRELGAELITKISIPEYFKQVIKPEMKDYYSSYEGEFEYRPTEKCPIHMEDTPSLRYYEGTASFYCFGCNRGGDVISLHRYFVESRTGKKPTYGEAVKFLQSKFIEDGLVDGAEVFIKKEEHELTPEEKSRLVTINNQINRVEEDVKRDKMISTDSKKEIYDAIDLAGELYDLGRLGVDELGQMCANIMTLQQKGAMT